MRGVADQLVGDRLERVEAVDGLRPLRIDHRAGREIPVPDAELGRGSGDGQPLLAVPERRLGARLLDGGPGALGHVLDERRVRLWPASRLGMMDEQHGGEPAALDQRHGQDGARADGGERVGRRSRGARVGGHVVDAHGPAGFQLGDDRRAEIVHAVPPGDAAQPPVGPVALDGDVLLRLVHLAVPHPGEAEMAAERSGRGGHHLDRVGQLAQTVAEVDEKLEAALRQHPPVVSTTMASTPAGWSCSSRIGL